MVSLGDCPVSALEGVDVEVTELLVDQVREFEDLEEMENFFRFHMKSPWRNETLMALLSSSGGSPGLCQRSRG